MNLTITLTNTNKWCYCAKCGQKLDAAWMYCPGCAQPIGTLLLYPYVFPHIYYPSTSPVQWEPTTVTWTDTKAA